MRPRRLPRSLVALLLVALVALAGCGGGGASGGSGGGDASHTVMRVGSIWYTDSLNPFVAIEPQADTIFTMEYPQIVQYGPGLKLEGDWARSWTHTPDGLRWTFHLIPGGKWSDGVPLTAEDAAWTGNLILRYQDGATRIWPARCSGSSTLRPPTPTHS